jgi:Family of unknown function (DUF5923)
MGQDMFKVHVPRVFAKMRNVPVPRNEYTDDETEFLLENLGISGFNTLPSNAIYYYIRNITTDVDVVTSDILSAPSRPTIGTLTHWHVHVQAMQVQLTLNDISFWYHDKTALSISPNEFTGPLGPTLPTKGLDVDPMWTPRRSSSRRRSQLPQLYFLLPLESTDPITIIDGRSTYNDDILNDILVSILAHCPIHIHGLPLATTRKIGLDNGHGSNSLAKLQFSLASHTNFQNNSAGIYYWTGNMLVLVRYNGIYSHVEDSIIMGELEIQANLKDKSTTSDTRLPRQIYQAYLLRRLRIFNHFSTSAPSTFLKLLPRVLHHRPLTSTLDIKYSRLLHSWGSVRNNWRR